MARKVDFDITRCLLFVLGVFMTITINPWLGGLTMFLSIVKAEVTFNAR